jgi:hypothetical protein
LNGNGLLHSLVVMLVLLALPVGAQDGGLYGSGAPDDAAFVRLVHASPGDGAVATSLGDTELGPIEHGAVTPYRPVATGLFTVRLAGGSAELVARNGAYYTIALLPDRLLVFEDPEHTDPAQAQLFLYNLRAEGEVGLRAAERETEIIPPVAPGASRQVAVTPVAVELAVYRGDTQLAMVGDPGLERGESYSVFVVAADGDGDHGPRTVFVEQARIAAE